MKIIQSSFVRAITAIIVGALLIKYREETVEWLIKLTGVLFFVSGLISTITYFVAKKSAADTQVFNANGQAISGYQPPIPVVGVGSMVLGVVLTLMPTIFITIFVYILAAILIMGSINQYINLAHINRIIRIGFVYWLLPTVVLLIGVIAIAKPVWIASMPQFIMGWTLVLYGIIECIGAFKTITVNRKYKPTAQTTIIKSTESQSKVIDKEVDADKTPATDVQVPNIEEQTHA